MKTTINLVIAGLLVFIFGLKLLMFQVRQTEVVVVTRFGKPVRDKLEPGVYFKLPWPIEREHRFDKRIHNFEDTLEPNFTQEKYTVMIKVYAGWTISEPKVFFPSFGRGDTNKAAASLESLIRTAKNAVVGQHPFSHFISTDPAELKLEQIEKEILGQVQQKARNQYGIDVKFVGIQRLALPEPVTKAVFERMRAERGVLVSSIESEGQTQANVIQDQTNEEKINRLGEARQKAERLQNEAQDQIRKALIILDQNPELANLLLTLRALESVTNRTTWILDGNTLPFDVLPQKSTPKTSPIAK